MPFDPTQPAPNSGLSSAVMREQLNALHEEITSIPAGPPGPEGPQGPEGPEGPPGQPGQVTLAQLAEAIAGTARNPIGLAPLTQTISDPVTQEQVQNIQNLLNLFLTESQRPPT